MLIFRRKSEDITSDSDESEDDQPRRKRVACSKDLASATPPAPVEVSDLMEKAPNPQPEKSNTPDNSAPIRRGERTDLWTYSQPSCFTYGIIPPPEPRRIITVDDDDSSTPRGNSSSPMVNLYTDSSPPPQSPIENRLLPQILKAEPEEPLTSALVMVKRRPLHSKPRAKRFKSNSRKGRKRIANFVNLHLPFGYKPLPKVDLGTLDDALRKLGVDV